MRYQTTVDWSSLLWVHLLAWHCNGTLVNMFIWFYLIYLWFWEGFYGFSFSLFGNSDAYANQAYHSCSAESSEEPMAPSMLIWSSRLLWLHLKCHRFSGPRSHSAKTCHIVLWLWCTMIMITNLWHKSINTHCHRCTFRKQSDVLHLCITKLRVFVSSSLSLSDQHPHATTLDATRAGLGYHFLGVCLWPHRSGCTETLAKRQETSLKATKAFSFRFFCVVTYSFHNGKTRA